MRDELILGAVAYDAKVVPIWEGFRAFFNANGLPFDFVLYQNYERQVAAHLRGDIHVAWNSPLAWLQAERAAGAAGRRAEAIAMRDTDRDLTSVVLVRAGSGIADVRDLAGRAIGVGAHDSPQATLIPLGLLARHGLEPGRDVEVRRFDVLVGKHGDHVGGERDAFAALASGEAAASAMLDLNWETWTRDGTVDPERYRILATTDRFDHCVFAVRADFPAELERRWLEVLFSMSYQNPEHRRMMELEGLKEWLPGRTSGFGPLAEAVEGQRFFESG